MGRRGAKRLAAAISIGTVAVALTACGSGAAPTGSAGSIPPVASVPAAITSPGATTSPAPSAAGIATPPLIATDGSQATRADTPFESARYGYRLVVPKGWTINEVDGTGGLHPDEPGVDTFRDRFGHILSVVGEPVDDPDAWSSSIDRHLRGDHALSVEAREALSVAGVPATLTEYHLPIPPSYLVHYLDVALVNAGLGTVLSLESTTRDDGGDRAILDGFLQTLEVGTP